jgi:hypothetical protein
MSTFMLQMPCVLVHWFKHLGDSPNENTEMWVVKPEVHKDGTCFASVIHLDRSINDFQPVSKRLIWDDCNLIHQEKGYLPFWHI